MKNTISLILLALILVACSSDIQEPQKNNDQPTTSNTEKLKEIPKETIEIPTTLDLAELVNNPTPLRKGYEVDTTKLKKPMLIDFNGDGKLDAFRVLKNPNKTGLKYLFEFRIADTDQVYFYESEDKEYDLDSFDTYHIAKKGEQFVDISKLDHPDLMAFEDAPKKAQLTLAKDGITVGLLESCGTSLYFLENDKIHRIYLD